jgi:hypothetical protein
MNGYLMQEQRFIRGGDVFIESFAQENKHGVVFEDDGETGYFYAVERDDEGPGMRVLDALHIYEVPDAGAMDGNNEGEPGEGGGESREDGYKRGENADEAREEGGEPDVDGAEPDEDSGESGEGRTREAAGGEMKLQIVWSRDWEKCALVIDGYCHAIYDFQAQGGYSINEFPPPNEIWTKGERKLTDVLIRSLF